MNSPDVEMWYVAEDPAQPGAAYAVSAEYRGDDKAMRKRAAETISQWLKAGAIVHRMTLEQAREMLSRWVRPMRESKSADAQPDIFGERLKDSQ